MYIHIHYITNICILLHASQRAFNVNIWSIFGNRNYIKNIFLSHTPLCRTHTRIALLRLSSSDAVCVSPSERGSVPNMCSSLSLSVSICPAWSVCILETMCVCMCVCLHTVVFCVCMLPPPCVVCLWICFVITFYSCHLFKKPVFGEPVELLAIATCSCNFRMLSIFLWLVVSAANGFSDGYCLDFVSDPMFLLHCNASKLNG